MRWTQTAAAAALLLVTACASGGAGDTEHVDAMAREHAGETPVASGAVAPPAREVVGHEVVYGTAAGQRLSGYLAEPVGARPGLPGVIVVHEWWGLNDNVRAMTRRLAGEGYTALAVDLYGGRTAGDAARARELMSQAMERSEAGLENLSAAARFLRQEEGASRVGILGWCFGGGWSLRAGVGIPEQIDAVVMYYGQPITDRDRLARLDAPLLGLFAAEDQGIPVAQVREMERILRDLGKEATIVVYPGVGHAFANPSGDSYDAAAARLAWERATRFLAEQLK